MSSAFVLRRPNPSRSRRQPVVAAATRRHGRPDQHDRRELERGGWRTTLDYRENLVRSGDGRLRQIEVVWSAEAERSGPDGVVQVVAATAPTTETVWARLRSEADLVEVRERRRTSSGELSSL